MNFNEYQKKTKETEIYTDAAAKMLGKSASYESIKMVSAMYCGGKLSGETGEINEIIFKAFRGQGYIRKDDREKLFKEFGDVLWYVSRLADLCGFDLEAVAMANLEKLADRKERGVLHGYGDNR